MICGAFCASKRHQGHIPGSQAVLDIFLSRDLQLLTMVGWENRDKDSQSDIAAENLINTAHTAFSQLFYNPVSPSKGAPAGQLLSGCLECLRSRDSVFFWPRQSCPAFAAKTTVPGIVIMTSRTLYAHCSPLLFGKRISTLVRKESTRSNASLFMGKPAVTVECGKLGRTGEEDITAILNGCSNILKHLNMIEGQPELLFDPVWIRKTTYIRSEHQGIFYPLSQGGRYVQKGELLGYLTDFFGNIIQKALAPHDGIVMYIIATPPMSKGEPMVKIGGF